MLLRWDKIDLERRRIWIKQFKTGKEVTILIAGKLDSALRQALEWRNDEYVLPKCAARYKKTDVNGKNVGNNLINIDVLRVIRWIGLTPSVELEGRKESRNMNNTLRLRTVKLINSLMHSLVNEGIIQVNEEQIISSNLKRLATHGELMPPITPKLVDQKEAAEMLGLGLSNFKKLEKEEAFPFKRRMVGRSVRYRNLDVLRYIMMEEGQKTE